MLPTCAGFDERGWTMIDILANCNRHESVLLRLKVIGKTFEFGAQNLSMYFFVNPDVVEPGEWEVTIGGGIGLHVSSSANPGERAPEPALADVAADSPVAERTQE